MIARYASAVTTGTLMTFGLLFVMQLLITLQPGAQVEVRDRHYLSPFTAPSETPVKTIDEIPPVEKLTKTELPPGRPQLESDPGSIGVPMPPPPAPGGIAVIKDFNAISDGALVSIVKVAPSYPSRAIARNLEGTVLVQFDVDAKGQVINVNVVESSDSVFERSAVEAAKRFRFKPRVIDGVPLVTHGIQNLFRFTLDD